MEPTTTTAAGLLVGDRCACLQNVPEDYEPDEQCKRQSQDSGTVNFRGRSLLETCTALNLRILNGRIVGDLDGKKTCFHYNGSSVVYYVIGSKNILRNVRYLIVNPLKPHFSDHCRISYAIKTNLVRSIGFSWFISQLQTY